MKRRFAAATAAVLALGLTAACGGGGDAEKAQSSKGPIKVWLSNNPEEIAWGKAMVKEWNSAHPDEKVSAAITAGNAPCLVFNTSPAAVPQFEKQGGLVALDSFPKGAEYIESRSGASADQYKSPDGKFYQIPWKQNPVMIFYNKQLFQKAGIDTANPPLKTYDEFLAASKKIVDSGAAPNAISPAPSSEFFQSWFDFYPLYAAESGGKQTIEDGKATFDDPAGKDVWNFWHEMYAKGYSPQEKYDGDSFADKKAAMAVVGPWAIAATRSPTPRTSASTRPARTSRPPGTSSSSPPARTRTASCSR
jgi:multiple sugar transport system substrate-binding protein